MNVGTELEASCENCASTTQTVTSVSHGATATVMCNGCGATRRYVASVDSIVPEKTETVVAAVSKPATKRARKPKAAWSPDQSQVAAVLSRPVRPYRLADSYRLGDRIDHNTYGIGIVDEILGPTKMQVFFTSGHRKMMQGALTAA
ncbi:MAG: hypothetical protein IPK07_32650 [Deltaproteobacteria bacterium]|jgi:hypothetical protein|nr:hypothetical protein [Deltaproteobacteria bacterium]